MSSGGRGKAGRGVEEEELTDRAKSGVTRQFAVLNAYVIA